jgi:outer membrane lipopolysaccharide assembly protein LptE/RlpB
MKTMLMLAALLASALLLTACPFTARGRAPCPACDEECDDHGCNECRAKHCPDAGPDASDAVAHAATDLRDRC